MEYRKFGDTDLLVSEIGFGAWAIGGASRVGETAIGWGHTDDEVSKQTLKTAMDAGINFFDTADFYGLGHSENLIGAVLGDKKDMIIATKVGQKVGANGDIEHDNSKNYIINACEESLKRLNRDVIDYYQLHVGQLKSLEQGECIEAMQILQQQGKIRFWGHSLFTWKPAPEAEYLMQNRLGDGFQMVINAINQIAVPVMQEAAANGYGIIARMPFQFGLLTGNIKAASRFEKDDHRSFRLTDNIIQASLDILRTEMLPLAKQYNTSVSGIALSFILGFDEVSTVIPGMRTPDQVIKNTSHLVKLNKFDHQYLQSLYLSKWQPVLELMKKQG